MANAQLLGGGAPTLTLKDARPQGGRTRDGQRDGGLKTRHLRHRTAAMRGTRVATSAGKR